MPKLNDDDNSPCGEGNQVEDNKHKETVGVEMKQSLTESSATYSSRFHELIDEMETHQSSYTISPRLHSYLERYARLVPERDEAKETEASFPQAWSMINFSIFKANLDKAENMYFERSVLALVRLLHSFGSAFFGVSFTWEDISKDPFSSTLDIPICPEYDNLVAWIVSRGPTLSLLRELQCGLLVIFSILCFTTVGKRVSIFPALALVLRSHPIILPVKIRVLNEVNLWYQKKGALTCPISVWMVHQVSFVDVHAALHSWVRFLLPQLQVLPHSREFILQSVEKILEKPEAQAQLVESPTYWNDQLLPRDFFEILLRVTFPARSSATEEEALEIALWCMKSNVGCWEDWNGLWKENLEASVTLLETLTENETLNLNLLTSPSSSNLSRRRFIRPIFAFCLTLAGEGNPVLAKEAAKIAIWCMKTNVDCWSHLRYYKMNLEDSVALLKALVGEWPALSLKLPSSGEPFIQQIFIVSLGIAGEENPVLAKEATEIAIWSLTKNFDFCTHWDNLYEENIIASVALLKKLVREWNDLSLKLSSSPSDTLTLSQTIKSFRLKNQKAIAQGGASGYLFKYADKLCKMMISGRLSRGSCSLKWACISYVVLVASLVPFYLTVFGLYK